MDVVVVTPELLTAIMPAAGVYKAQIFAPLLERRMSMSGIDTPLRVAHFLAQIGHESGQLRYVEEIASGVAYEGRIDLGNTEQGDGKRFKGRGLIQLTGRANYAEYSNYAGIDYVSHPEWLSRPEDAVAVSCWFWGQRGLNKRADEDDLKGVTRRINGGYNGLADREQLLNRAKKVLL